MEKTVFEKFKVTFSSPSSLEQRFFAHNLTSNLVLCVSLYLHLMDQFRWKLIMDQEALRERRRLLMIYGLYWQQGQFLEEAYPVETSKQPPKLLKFPLREQLMYLLLLYLWKV